MDEPVLIAETPELVAFEKPAGLLVHPGPHPTSDPTVADWLRARYPETAAVGDAPAIRPGIVHRLDRATSGVMVAARTQEAYERLKLLFQERQVEKEYRAIVHGVMHPASGRIDRPIGILPRTTKRSVFSEKMRKPAATRYETVEQLARIAHVAAFPETGRTHQIRVHFASVGHPLLGDPLYAPKRTVPHAARLMLHAYRIAFDLEGSRHDYQAPLPAAFEELLAAERGAA